MNYKSATSVIEQNKQFLTVIFFGISWLFVQLLIGCTHVESIQNNKSVLLTTPSGNVEVYFDGKEIGQLPFAVTEKLLQELSLPSLWLPEGNQLGLVGDGMTWTGLALLRDGQTPRKIDFYFMRKGVPLTIVDFKYTAKTSGKNEMFLNFLEQEREGEKAQSFKREN
jgi:hypothetical protein